MPKILLSNHYSELPYSIISKVVPSGFTLDMLERVDVNSFLSKVGDAEYILASGRLPINGQVLQRAHKLKMIQRTGVGIDMIDTFALQKQGIPLYVNPGINADSVAEHSILLMLAVLRRVTILNSQVHSAVWNKQENGVQNRMLKGRVVGLLGIGNIGKTVARLLNAFGATVVYFDIHRLPIEEEIKHGVKYLSLDELLSGVEILSIHCALTPETRHIINKESLAKMQKGSVLINTARGPLVDTVALCEALDNGILKGAGLDVFENEPIDPSSPLLSYENVIMTPHVGGVTYDAFQDMMSEAMHNIELFEKGCFSDIESRRYYVR